MRVIEHPAARSAYLVLSLLVLLAGDAIRFAAGWFVFGALSILLAAASVVLLVAQRDRWAVGRLPYPLLAFLAVATLSLAWSFYPAATALGLFTTWLIALSAVAIAVTFSWAQLLRGLAISLALVLGLSLLFELVVAVVIRQPVLPVFANAGVDYSQYETIPRMLYWSRNELFEVFGDGRIQGLLGNANNLGMLALLGVIVFAIRAADGTARRRLNLGWLAVAAATLVFTRSATVTVALVAVLVAAAAIILIRTARTPRERTGRSIGIAAVLVAGVGLVVALQGQLLALLGKSPDLTGRLGIWEDVAAFAVQRPVQGWGWVSYWVPWAAPFDTLTSRNGVRQLQAHDAWLDLWLQLGIIGLIVFGALVLSTAVRSWSFALDRPQVRPGSTGAYTAAAMLPALVMVALLVQSIAESRLLVEYGFALLAVFAIKTKASDTVAYRDRAE